MKKLQKWQIVFWVLMLFLGNSLYNNLKLYFKAQESLKKAVTTQNELESKKRELLNTLSETKSLTYVEKIARDTLGLGREGEVIAILPPANELKKLSPRLMNSQNLDKETEAEPNWKLWLKLLI